MAQGAEAHFQAGQQIGLMFGGLAVVTAIAVVQQYFTKPAKKRCARAVRDLKMQQGQTPEAAYAHAQEYCGTDEIAEEAP